jgi:hypothetical protein
MKEISKMNQVRIKSYKHMAPAAIVEACFAVSCSKVQKNLHNNTSGRKNNSRLLMT